MIDKALEFLVGELNTFLGGRFPVRSEQHVVLANMSSPDSDAARKIENKVVLSLVNLERENAAPTLPGAGTRRGGGPALHLNLYVLVAASYAGNYPQALALLSSVLGFFQGRQSFTQENSAAMPAELARLNIELVSQSMTEVNNLWAILGAKFMPSALYRIRMLSIDQDWLKAPVPEVLDVQTRVRQ
jgi:hypothetical protein